MTALEQEVIDKFHQLDREAQQRVRALIERETEPDAAKSARGDFDFAAWSREVEAVREQIRVNHEGKFPSIDIVKILRDIRDGE